MKPDFCTISLVVAFVAQMLMGLLIPANVAAASSRANAEVKCAKIQQAVQPLVAGPVALHQADDGTTSALHPGESGYLDCDFRQQSGLIDISIITHTRPTFGEVTKGHAALSGFGDRATFADSGGMRWVDIKRGGIGCEARFGGAIQVKGDWKQAGGKLCDAAFAIH